MKHVLDIVTALENEIVSLETTLAAIEARDDSLGHSHIARIKVLIEDLKREIELNTPRRS